MNADEILNIYDELDSAGVEFSTESREVHSVLTALNDASDEDLPPVLQSLTDEGYAHNLHAYVKNELLALRRILRDDAEIKHRYTKKLVASLLDDVQIAKKQINEQYSKLQDL